MSSACTGILRGYQQKQIKTKDGKTCSAMHAVKYNSGISGGSIPSALYTFAQVPTDELLETGRLVDPEAMSWTWVGALSPSVPVLNLPPMNKLARRVSA